MFMNIKKWPYWLRGGLVAGVIGTLFFLIFPENFQGNDAPWYLGWMGIIAFMIFAPIAILFQIDFISEAASSSDKVMATFISGFSFFVTFFMVGALVTILIRKLKTKRRIDA